MTWRASLQSSRVKFSDSQKSIGLSWDQLVRDGELLEQQKTAEQRIRHYFSGLRQKAPPIFGQAPLIFLWASQSQKLGRLVVGGNKSGKSSWGTIESILWSQGIHPFRKTPPPPTYIRIVTPDLPFPRRPHPIRDLLQRWTPPMWLRGRSWQAAWGDNARTLWFQNGSKIEFISGGQEAVQQAGAWNVSAIWYDEAIAEIHFRENLMRLDVENAAWWFTFCPANCGPQPWIFERWFSPKSEPDPNTEIFKVSTRGNSHNLPLGKVDEMKQSLLPHEIASRIEGEFSDIEGRVYDFHVGTTNYGISQLEKDTEKWGQRQWGEG